MKFLSNVLATIVGLFIFSILSFFFFFIIIAVISSAAGDSVTKIDDQSVLHLKLNKPILEREREDPFEGMTVFPGIEEGGIGLVELKDAIRHAATDDKIEGIYLETPVVMAGFTKLKEIRDALSEFKTSGKFIIASSQFYSEGAYYLASVADEVLVSPVYTFIEFNGLNADRTFFKGTMDKLGIEPYIFKVGDYKDAIEPFIRKDFSQESRDHTAYLLDGLYKDIIADIAQSRHMEQGMVRNIADSMLVNDGEDAVAFGLADNVAHEDEVYDLIREKCGLEEDEKINFVSYKKYCKSYKQEGSSKNRIAVIVADGEIIGGEGDGNTIGAEKFVKEIRAARENSRIKAIVLRINSPGGSAAASDLIWRELKLAGEEKPLIASMSDVAASGGYFIALGCDTILAHPQTITGSIGVFGMFFNIGKMLDEKLGITTDNVQTGHYSDLFNISRAKSAYELQFLQKTADNVYDDFVHKTSEATGLTPAEIEPLASGRVWTGEDAVKFGLVDMLGTLDDAIEIAARNAGIEDDYRVRYYPVQKSPMEELLQKLSGEDESSILKKELGKLYPSFEEFRSLTRNQGIQARLPYGLTYGF